MKYERTKEGYAEYLKSDHWKQLRRIVLRRDKCRCQECHKFGWQVHHRFYRDDWEDAQPEDCVTLCRRCHEKQHGIAAQNRPTPKPNEHPVGYESKHSLMKARGLGLITRSEFLELKAALKSKGGWRGKSNRNGRRKTNHRRVKRSKWSKDIQRINSWTMHMTNKPRPHYVNRGTSSN